MDISMFHLLLAKEGIIIGWVLFLCGALLVLFRYGIRKIDSRPTALLLGSLILILSLGQFLFFYFYYSPAAKEELRAEIEALTDKSAILGLENVNQNDLVVAYKRENEILDRQIGKFRSRNTMLEERVENLTLQNEQLENNLKRAPW